jgi:hypothetical protein
MRRLRVVSVVALIAASLRASGCRGTRDASRFPLELRHQGCPELIPERSDGKLASVEFA